MSDNDTLIVYGNTEALDIIVEVNELLLEHGLEFKDVTEPEADHVEYQLIKLEEEEDA